MLRIIFLLLITSASFGQVLQETNGSRAENRIVHKLGFRLPQVCWVTGNPNLLNYSAFMSKGAMVYDTCAGKIKRWSGSAWISIQDSTAGGGGTPGGGTYSIQYNRAGAFAGRSTFVFDTVNARVGIGTASPAAVLSIVSNIAAGLNSGINIQNSNAGAGAYSVVNLYNNNNDIGQFFLTSTGYTPAATLRAAGIGFYNTGVGGISLVASSDNANSVITFATGATPVERMRITSSGVIVGTGNTNSASLSVESISANASVGLKSSLSTGEALIFLANDQSAATAGGSFGIYGSNYSLALSHLRNQVAFGSRQGLLFLSDNTTSTGGTSPIDFYPGGSSQSQRFVRMKNFGMAINSAGTTADPVASAVLDINSTTKGFLRPRQTTGQRDAIASAATGLSVYNTTLSTNDVKTAAAWYQQPNGLTGSATLDFPSTNAHSSSDLTLTVTGAAVGDIVILGTPVQDIDATYTAFVSLANTVTVRFNHYGSGTTNPASGTFKVYVIKN